MSKYRAQSLKVKTNQEYKALMSEIEHAEARSNKLRGQDPRNHGDRRRAGKTLKQAEAALKGDTAEKTRRKKSTLGDRPRKTRSS